MDDEGLPSSTGLWLLNVAYIEKENLFEKSSGAKTWISLWPGLRLIRWNSPPRQHLRRVAQRLLGRSSSLILCIQAAIGACLDDLFGKVPNLFTPSVEIVNLTGSNLSHLGEPILASIFRDFPSQTIPFGVPMQRSSSHWSQRMLQGHRDIWSFTAPSSTQGCYRRSQPAIGFQWEGRRDLWRQETYRWW